ncbi:MAG: helix-turn-helix transcriptional regulator [Candidatus Binatia bacterium]
MAKKKRTTTDAVEIITRRYFTGRKGLDERYEQEVANLEVARKLYELRTKAGLTQRQLAKLVGTSPSAICRLEDADYEGHSLSMLRRIAAALSRQVEIHFVPATRRRRAA